MNAIGIDLGTTSLSAIVMEEGTGEVVETINLPNEAVMNEDRRGRKSRISSIFSKQCGIFWKS